MGSLLGCAKGCVEDAFGCLPLDDGGGCRLVKLAPQGTDSSVSVLKVGVALLNLAAELLDDSGELVDLVAEEEVLGCDNRRGLRRPSICCCGQVGLGVDLVVLGLHELLLRVEVVELLCLEAVLQKRPLPVQQLVSFIERRQLLLEMLGLGLRHAAAVLAPVERALQV